MLEHLQSAAIYISTNIQIVPTCWKNYAYCTNTLSAVFPYTFTESIISYTIDDDEQHTYYSFLNTCDTFRDRIAVFPISALRISQRRFSVLQMFPLRYAKFILCIGHFYNHCYVCSQNKWLRNLFPFWLFQKLIFLYLRKMATQLVMNKF